MPTPRHWGSLVLGDVRQPEMEISSPDCPPTSGPVGNHINYSGRNALLMISTGADAITTVEGDTGSSWCNACSADAAAAASKPEVVEKTAKEHSLRQPAAAANAIRNLVVIGLSCVLVVSAFRSAECLESSLNDSARLGVVALCLMHAAAAGTCYIVKVKVTVQGKGQC